MRTYDELIAAYAADHQNPTNQRLHKVCVPLIMFSLLGLLWALPSPELFRRVAGLNWATLVVALALYYYFFVDRLSFFVMLVQSTLMLTGIAGLAAKGPLVPVCAVIFALAWVGQFVGHSIEGKRPSFLRDLQFLLIGPLWTHAGWLERFRR